MKSNDWKNLFGKADEGFLRHLDRTLGGLSETSAPRRHARPSLALIAAALIVLMAGTALAMGPGFIEKLNSFIWFQLPPDAEELVETDLGGAQTDLFTIDVEQALYDGRSALVQLRLTPRDNQQYELLCAETVRAYDVREQGAPAGERKIVLCDVNLTCIGGSTGGMQLDGGGLEHYDDGSFRIWFVGSADSVGKDKQKVLVHFRWGIAGEITPPEYARYTEIEEMWLPEDDEFLITLEKQAETRYHLSPAGESEQGVLTLLTGSAVVTPLRTYLDFTYDRETDSGDSWYLLDFTDGNGRSFVDAGGRVDGGNWEIQRDGNLFYHVTDHILRLDPVPEQLIVELKTMEGDVIDRAAFALSPAE